MISKIFNCIFCYLLFFIFSCEGKLSLYEQKKVNRLNKILHFFENRKMSLDRITDIRQASIFPNDYLIPYKDLPIAPSEKEWEDSLARYCKYFTKNKIIKDKNAKVKYERYLKYSKNQHHRSIFNTTSHTAYLTLYVCEVSENIVGVSLNQLSCYDPKIGWEGCKKYYEDRQQSRDLNIFASFCFDEKDNIEYVFLHKKQFRDNL